MKSAHEILCDRQVLLRGELVEDGVGGVAIIDVVRLWAQVQARCLLSAEHRIGIQL